jgi:hypothetical protein
MSGPLLHEPGFVLRQALVDMGLAAEPDATEWPAYHGKEPPTPDDVITVSDTAGRNLGRAGPDWEEQELYGVQVRVRSGDDAGGRKVRDIALALAKLQHRLVVVEGTTYTIADFSRSSGPIPLGEEDPASSRKVFTLNGLLTMTMLP